MTSLPTQKGEREEALITRLRKEAAWQADYYAGAPCSEILSEAANAIERLLSSAKAEGEMRAFVQKVADIPDGRPTASRAMRLNDIVREARAALSPKKGD